MGMHKPRRTSATAVQLDNLEDKKNIQLELFLWLWATLRSNKQYLFKNNSPRAPKEGLILVVHQQDRPLSTKISLYFKLFKRFAHQLRFPSVGTIDFRCRPTRFLNISTIRCK